MRFTYSPDIDVLYVQLRSNDRTGAAVRNLEIAPGVIADFDAEDRFLGVEVLGASRHVPADQLTPFNPGPA